MDAHQQWWHQYYSTAAPSAGYGPLTNAVRHHYQRPYHIPAAPTTDHYTTATPTLGTAFPPEPLPPPPATAQQPPPPLQIVPPNTPNIPDTWTPSDTHLDTNTVHGQTLFRTIQLDIFPWQLSRFGLQDPSLRTLSQGRYTGIVTTRSIAEAVFTSQLLTEIRAHNLDIDNIAEYLHQQAHQPVPNKTTDAKQFMQPLISRLTDFLRGLTPPAGEGTALRKLQQQTDRLHQQESELQRARDKLKNHGIALTPAKPGATPTTSSGSHPTLPLTAPAALTAHAILNPTSQTLQDNSPVNYAPAGIQKWLNTLPPAAQTQATNIMQVLRDERINKEQLQEAATRYGIPNSLWQQGQPLQLDSPIKQCTNPITPHYNT